MKPTNFAIHPSRTSCPCICHGSKTPHPEFLIEKKSRNAGGSQKIVQIVVGLFLFPACNRVQPGRLNIKVAPLSGMDSTRI
jgi:hypothetical protein